MSDNEEFLGDDFGDPGADDTYNLGNEEEEILLAGGNISDCAPNDNNKTHNVQSKERLNFKDNHNESDQIRNVDKTVNVQNVTPSSYTNKSSNIDQKQPQHTKNLVEDKMKTACETKTTSTTETATGDYRYRADHKERFPTERSETHGTNLPVIPDSLDTVVTTEEINPQFRNRKQNNHGRRMNNRPMKRPDFQRTQNTKQMQPNESRNFHPDFRPYPRDMQMNRGMRPRAPMPMHHNDFHPRGDFMPSNNPNFAPRMGPGHLRFMNDVRPPFQPHPRPFHDSGMENMGPNNIRTSVDLRSGAAAIHRDFRPTIPQLSPRNFSQFPENFINSNNKNVYHPEFKPQDDDIRQPNNRFSPLSRMGDNPNNFGPRGFDQMPRNKHGPPFNNSRDYMEPEININVPSNFVPRDLDKKGLIEPTHPGLFDSQFPPNSKDDFFKSGPPNETKKVHINPHFKGVVPPDFMQQQHESFNDRFPAPNNYNSFGGNNFNQHGNSDGYMQNRTPTDFINNQMMGGPNSLNRIGFNDKPVNEKELDRLTEQFINEQQRCLQRASADYYEKTQRFIENTSLTVRNQPVDEERDRKKEYLKRKQEEFIIENDKLLNLRRRRVSPPRPAHRSPPPPVRHRTSPYKRPRGRSSISPPQRREQSGEPEDRAYRVKLREQAEMRARVLQAKERRRRRDAATLMEKLNQPPSIPSKQDINKSSNSTEQLVNNKRMEDSSRTNSSNQFNDDKNYKAPVTDNKNVAFEDKTSKSPPFVNKQEIKTSNDKAIENEKQSTGETLEDMLEDDLLRLSPEDEELLLSDEEDLTLPISFSKTTSVKSENKPTFITKIVTKDSTKVVTLSNSNVKQTSSVKRPANFDSKEDLRSKLKKNSENNQQITNSLNTSPRRKITFSHDNKDVPNKLQFDDDAKAEKKESERGNKWRSTFSEQKLDLTAPVAARAISAVMRNTSESSRKTIVSKNIKSATSQSLNERESDDSNKLQNGSSTDKAWSGRQVVVGMSGRRVVIPPRQKPLVVVENDEEDPFDTHIQATKQERTKTNKKTALVTGLPPGMTEARLLSLCGPEVEHVTVGAAGSADVNFSSADACDRFVRRFHGRLVAACRLSVTMSN